MIKVTVRYAIPDRQVEITLQVPENCTVEMAIRRSGILAEFPEIDLVNQVVGINSKRARLDTQISDLDFVEIYRPLVLDPKERRRLLARQSTA